MSNNMELLERIKIIIKRFSKGKKTIFARDVGLNESSVQKYFKSSRGDWFELHVKRICEVYPQINEQWLYTGEGEMLTPENVPSSDEVIRLQQELAAAKDHIRMQSEEILTLNQENRELRQQISLKKVVLVPGQESAHSTTPEE